MQRVLDARLASPEEDVFAAETARFGLALFPDVLAAVHPSLPLFGGLGRLSGHELRPLEGLKEGFAVLMG
jgi:hypothetical protein